MSSEKPSGSPSGSTPGSTSTSTFTSMSSGTASTTLTTPNTKNSKKWKISVEATSSNGTIDDSPGFKKIEPLKISTKPPVKEYKKSLSATQLALNWEKEQKERKGKQRNTKG